jgi:hypothetical protein
MQGGVVEGHVSRYLPPAHAHPVSASHPVPASHPRPARHKPKACPVSFSWIHALTFSTLTHDHASTPIARAHIHTCTHAHMHTRTHAHTRPISAMRQCWCHPVHRACRLVGQQRSWQAKHRKAKHRRPRSSAQRPRPRPASPSRACSSGAHTRRRLSFSKGCILSGSRRPPRLKVPMARCGLGSSPGTSPGRWKRRISDVGFGLSRASPSKEKKSMTCTGTDFTAQALLLVAVVGFQHAVHNTYGSRSAVTEEIRPKGDDKTAYTDRQTGKHCPLGLVQVLQRRILPPPQRSWYRCWHCQRSPDLDLLEAAKQYNYMRKIMLASCGKEMALIMLYGPVTWQQGADAVLRVSKSRCRKKGSHTARISPSDLEKS